MKKILFLSLLFLNTHSEELKKPKDSQPENQNLSKPPLTEAQATAMLQVAGGFLQILTNPHNQPTVTNGIGIMATGMANLFYQLMKSRGIDAQISDEELQNLAEEMAQIVNRSVHFERIKRGSLSSEV